MIVNVGIPAVEQLSLMTGVYAAIAAVVVLVAGPRFVRLPAPQDAAHARQETGGPIDGAVAATTSIRDHASVGRRHASRVKSVSAPHRVQSLRCPSSPTGMKFTRSQVPHQFGSRSDLLITRESRRCWLMAEPRSAAAVRPSPMTGWLHVVARGHGGDTSPSSNAPRSLAWTLGTSAIRAYSAHRDGTLDSGGLLGAAPRRCVLWRCSRGCIQT